MHKNLENTTDEMLKVKSTTIQARMVGIGLAGVLGLGVCLLGFELSLHGKSSTTNQSRRPTHQQTQRKITPVPAATPVYVQMVGTITKYNSATGQLILATNGVPLAMETTASTLYPGNCTMPTFLRSGQHITVRIQGHPDGHIDVVEVSLPAGTRKQC